MNATTDGSDSQWELVEEYIQNLVHDRAVNYIDLAAFIWGRKISWAKAVCLLNRYLSLLQFLLSLDPLLPTVNIIRCYTPSGPGYPCSLTTGFSGLRIYAISNQSRLVTLVVVLLALVPVGTNIYLETETVAYYDSNCYAGVNLSMDAYTICRTVTVITRGCLTASEGIVIVVTWMNTWHKDRATLQMNTRTSFMGLVLREGIVYFSVLLALNITQIIFTFVESDDFSILLQFTNVLTPILISRFYFDLDELQAQEWMTTLPSARHTTLRFATVQSVDSFDDTRSYDSAYGYGDEDATMPIGTPPPPLLKDRLPWSPGPARESKILYIY
ncbi:hypothetical protein C2E23DRAFT_934131 [Lenzites betulinus]|nr:hypothetical protein C2E23DRAFT_934131 [Lenzites betulinus]